MPVFGAGTEPGRWAEKRMRLITELILLNKTKVPFAWSSKERGLGAGSKCEEDAKG